MDSLINVQESEDVDLEEDPAVVQHKHKACFHSVPCLHMQPSDFPFERWARINPDTRQRAGKMFHISIFWWHILFQPQDGNVITAWATEMGFLDSNIFSDFTLKRLNWIEILELILQTVDACLNSSDPERKARELVSFAISFNWEDWYSKVVSWLQECGPKRFSRRLLELSPKDIRHYVLHFVFDEYARYIREMCLRRKKMMMDLSLDSKTSSLMKSEEMKSRGNEYFQNKNFDLAVKFYTEAIKYHPNNHLLYGNRALCFIICEKYLKAMGDGKRAIILKPDWAKGHYRFCDALFFLGAKEKALEANHKARSFCWTDLQGMRDLEQQYLRFTSEPCKSKVQAEEKPKKAETKKGQSKRSEGACAAVPDPEVPADVCVVEKKAEDGKEQQGARGKHKIGLKEEERLKAPKDSRSEMADRKTKKATQNIPEKQSSKRKLQATQEKPKPQTQSSEELILKQFCAVVQDAHTALSDQRCRNAEQAFSQALRILQSSGTKGLGVSELDKALLIYGYSTALIEIGQPEELLKAQKQFEELSSSGERKFQSLVHYGMGKVYLKENRFAKALEEFSNALLMLKRQITPGKLTWPTTKVTVEETQPEHLKNLLEDYIEMCKFPAKPDAVCRHQHCLGNAVEIYFTDPDFKGFIRMSCCQNCNVEFHIGCWKKIKAASFADKNDKDFLQDKCLTPDCNGKICQIVIFGSTGLIKCKFETSIPKIQLPGRMKVKQKCTSLKKLKSKENRKLKRKQRRAAASVAEEGSNKLTAEDEKENKKEEKATPTGHTLYGDRVLLQIYESRELFNDEICSISSIMICLKPWLELDESNGHVSMLKDRAEPRVLRDLVDLLLERRNRVWARLFVHNLSDCLNIKPKLHDWAQQLDKAGLKAAEKFIGCYGEVLGNLDLSMLLQFPPLQNVLIEKFGAMPELFETGLAVSDYIRQAPPQEMRLFIWTLEEHREQHPSCITLLDEYFEMDGICLVIRKTDDNLSSVYKSKSKHRKKRQKEPKPLIVLSGMRSRLQRDEEDEDIFFEDNSLMLLDDTDPFSVPDYLREQVADFEEHYVSPGPINRHKRFLDNNRDPTKESLYDYFAQILEEHGPLEASDPLLVGELKNFPTEAQQKILAAGGLKTFLTESLRFVLIDNLIALTLHSVSLQNANHNDSFPQMYGVIEPFSTLSSHLNPAAKEFLPQSKPDLSLSDSSASYGSPDFLTGEGLAAPFDSLPVTDPALPSPYVCGSRFPHYNYRFNLYNMDTPENQVQGEDDFLRPENGFNSAALSSDASDSDAYPEKEGEETVSASIYEEDTKADSANVSVQTDVKNISVKDEVAVNTEPYTVFEKNKGDMTAIEKNIKKFETTVQCVMETQESLQKKRTEHVSTLEAEVEEIHQKTEIANKELRMFQQMLEEEIRKEQQERRENQETLKALKGEIKELEDLLQSYSKQIQEKNMEYQTELDHFLATSNHNAAEKLNLEEQIKKCKDACAKAASRSETARLSVLCNRREKGLRRWKKNLSDWKVTLQDLTEMSSRFPSAGLLSSTKAWKAFVRETEEKITCTEGQYEEQIELVKKGTSLSSLPPVLVPSAPTPPPAPTFVHPPSSQPLPARHPAPHNPYGAQHQQQRAARSQAHPVRNAPLVQPADKATPSPPVAGAGAGAPFVSGEQAPRAPQHTAVFEKIVDRLSFMFPHYSRPVLYKFIQEARAVNGGTLNTLTYVDLINRVSSLILDHQEESLEQMSCVSGELASGGERAAPSPTPPADTFRATATSPPAHAWKSVSTQHRSSSKALNVEDPCIICHEDMLPEHVCVLQCRHSFHRECIKSWLKEQSTCPTCREHTLLPEDFPTLPHRRGHTSATSFF